MAKVIIDESRCKGCLLCAYVCPKKIIVAAENLNSKGYFPASVTDQSRCTGCAACGRMCSDVAIEVYK